MLKGNFNHVKSNFNKAVTTNSFDCYINPSLINILLQYSSADKCTALNGQITIILQNQGYYSDGKWKPINNRGLRIM